MGENSRPSRPEPFNPRDFEQRLLAEHENLSFPHGRCPTLKLSTAHAELRLNPLSTFTAVSPVPGTDPTS